MNEKILVVEDDFGTLKLIETILKKNSYQPFCYANPKEALRTYDLEYFDAIVSDFYMPEMNGDEFLDKVREKTKFLPFIVLTVNDDAQVAINLMKKGADDYINKPVVQDELLFRIAKNLEEKNNSRILERIEKEKEILQLESKRLVDWKMLYASKDVKQTEQLIEIFTRTLNQGGGYVWLDILKSSLEKIDDDYYKLSSSLVDLIIKTTESHQFFFDNITFLSNLESFDLAMEDIPVDKVIQGLYSFVNSELGYLQDKYERKILIQLDNFQLDAVMSVSMEYIKKIIKELIINAIKYSPEKTDIFVLFDKASDLKGNNLSLSVKNTPKKMHAKDLQGVDILGIPYEYSELVFDLFYTIDPFPNDNEDEEWSGGTGLYITRKIIKRHGGWIKTANGIDYTRGQSEPYVKFTIDLPYRKLKV